VESKRYALIGSNHQKSPVSGLTDVPSSFPPH
jgi:hypothetical protein